VYVEQSTLRWLAAALATGCVHAAPEPGPTGAVLGADFEQDLARLEALDVIEVGGVDTSVIQSAGNCYGLCPEDVEALRALQGPRLRALVDVAEDAVKEPLSCEGVDVEKQLRSLSELQIVSGVALVQEEAQPEPNCYNLPCPDEVERVQQRNCERVGKLASIVAASRDL
jgi:hypothetical protein